MFLLQSAVSAYVPASWLHPSQLPSILISHTISYNFLQHSSKSFPDRHAYSLSLQRYVNSIKQLFPSSDLYLSNLPNTEHHIFLIAQLLYCSTRVYFHLVPSVLDLIFIVRFRDRIDRIIGIRTRARGLLCSLIVGLGSAF